MNAFFANKKILTVEVAEALLTAFLFQRSFQRLPLHDRPRFNESDYVAVNLTTSFKPESQDGNVLLSDDIETVQEVVEFLRKGSSVSIDNILLHCPFSEFSRDKSCELPILKGRLMGNLELIGVRVNFEFQNIIDVICYQLSSSMKLLSKSCREFFREMEIFDENGQCIKHQLEQMISSENISADENQILKVISQKLGFVMIIVSSDEKIPITSLVPTIVRSPVPLLLGYISNDANLFLSLGLVLETVASCTCFSLPCSCNHQKLAESTPPPSMCRCGVNQTKSKADKKSCSSSKRCKCYSNSSACTYCKCKNCENPFGRVERTSERRKAKLSKRQLDLKAAYSGKLSRNFDASSFTDIKSSWNVYEKILVKRICKTLMTHEVDIVLEHYNKSVLKCKSKSIKSKSFVEVKDILKKIFK